jgi:hypothetical protein
MYKRSELTDQYTEVIVESLHYFSQKDLKERLMPLSI